MPRYEKNFITQVIIRADLARNTAPITGPDEDVAAVCGDYPVKNTLNRTKNEIRIEKTPQGPVKDTRTISFLEHNYWTQDKLRRVAVCSEYVFVQTNAYAGYEDLRNDFLAVTDVLAEKYPALRVTRLGMRYINEIKLPQADAGTGLGADFWQNYVNPLLLGGLRFAANDGALARHMCTTELNYGSDRATIKYGVFNAEYPKPNQRREFVLDVDAYCQTLLAAGALAGKLDDFHRAACSVFETAITDKLRARMGRI